MRFANPQPRPTYPWKMEIVRAIETIRLWNWFGFIEDWDKFEEFIDKPEEFFRWPTLSNFEAMTSLSYSRMKSIRLYRPLDDEKDIINDKG